MVNKIIFCRYCNKPKNWFENCDCENKEKMKGRWKMYRKARLKKRRKKWTKNNTSNYWNNKTTWSRNSQFGCSQEKESWKGAKRKNGRNNYFDNCRFVYFRMYYIFIRFGLLFSWEDDKSVFINRRNVCKSNGSWESMIIKLKGGKDKWKVGKK